jgi:arylsulfatase
VKPRPIQLHERRAALRLGAALVLASASCSGDTHPRRNVLLITVDTLRADHMGAYGYARATTPHLDRLAAESMVFEEAHTPRAKTTPAIVSLLTGRYPHDHGVRDLATPLEREVELLQEELREADYATGAIVGNWVLADARSGLARGFDLWCEEFPDSSGVPPDDVPQRRATSLTDAALVALGLQPANASSRTSAVRAFVEHGEPWFLWLHYMDPHGAYEPPVEHQVFERAAPDVVAARSEERPEAAHKRRIALYNVPESAWIDGEHIDAALVRDLYDGEIHYVDREIGRLLDALRSSRAWADTVVVFTSDHGESLGEQEYYFEHGANAYQATARVPLVVRAPGLAAGRSERLASLVDVTPTLRALLGLDVREHAPLAGTSLFDAPAPDSAARAVFVEKIEGAELDGAVQIKAARIGRYKLVQRYASRARADGNGRETRVVAEELYDLAADPLERFDLAPAVPGDAPMLALRRELARFVAADADLAQLGELLAARRRGLEIEDPESARTLRLLGY